jgi:hypothetical protein
MRRLALLVVAVALTACNSRGCKCHTGHSEVTYHAAYTTEDCHQHCFGSGRNEHCYSSCDTVSHPERCSVDFVCDFTCKQVDTGRAEQHPDHPTRHTAHINKSPDRCSDDGLLWPTARQKISFE